MKKILKRIGLTLAYLFGSFLFAALGIAISAVIITIFGNVVFNILIVGLSVWISYWVVTDIEKSLEEEREILEKLKRLEKNENEIPRSE